jgi:hypothetical protein
MAHGGAHRNSVRPGHQIFPSKAGQGLKKLEKNGLGRVVGVRRVAQNGQGDASHAPRQLLDNPAPSPRVPRQSSFYEL